jgi:transcriptional regulator of heat shock response
VNPDRRLEVLRAIVTDYVATHEPVGSRMLTQRHDLGVSPATIRNDMAALEEAGLIAQPHTSAGRIPTDAGYRLFVDRLAQVRPLSLPQRRAIETFLSDGVDLDDVISRASRLIAGLTGQVAIVQYPAAQRIAVAGVANLAAPTVHFEAGLRPVLEALEEHVVLMRLFAEMADDMDTADPAHGAATDSVALRIGHESSVEGLAETSVIVTGYGPAPGGDSPPHADAPAEPLATIGSIGPTSMDYPGTIATVRAVARYLSRMIST